VQLLLWRENIDLNQKTNGQTPLLAAVERGHEAVVRLLLERNDFGTESRDDD
jgi:ankyrin repeat protein